MAIPPPGPEKVPPGSVRDFVNALHALYDAAGRPGGRVISTQIRQSKPLEQVSHETVSSVLRGDSVPAWAKIKSVVFALVQLSIDRPDPDTVLREFHQLWLATQRDGPQAAPAQGRSGGARGEAGEIGEIGGARPRGDVGIVAVAIPAVVDPIAQSIALSLSLPPGITAPRQATPAGRVIGGLPERNPRFTGRELLLEGVRDGLEAHPTSPFVLYGLSGVGKTQLAREYVEKFGDTYTVIWWVPADRPERARTSLVALAERLGIAMQPSAEQTIAGLLGRLESQVFDFLLILDGAESDDIRRMIPAIGGHVIVTTHDPTWAHENSSMAMEVPDFSPAEAIQFLRRCDDQLTGALAAELAEVIGSLPLALEQITSLQGATSEPWVDLIAVLRTPEPGPLPDGRLRHYPEAVAISLQLALDQLGAVNPIAVSMFELFAWFGPAPVSVALLLGGRQGNVSMPLARTLRDPYQLRKAIADMSRLGLVRLHAHTQSVEMQRLARLALRDMLTPEAQSRAQHNVHEILAAADPGWPDALPSTELHREMAAHILPTGLIQSRMEGAQRAVLNQIRYRYMIADYEDACHLSEVALSAWQVEDFLGPEHAFVLLAKREWANALRAAGRYDAARQRAAEAMSVLRTSPQFGADHPDTLAMARGFAADLRLAGQYAEALRLDEDTHRRLVTQWGEADRQTAISHHNVGVSLRLVGRFDQALDIDREDLDRHRESLGPFHVITLLAANALGEDLYGLGRYREVLDLLVPLLDAWRQAGSGNPGVILVNRTVALARAGLGDMATADEALRAHHHRCIEAFGADHEHSLAATVSYANVLRQRGWLDEARIQATDACSAYRRMFGVRHPFALAAEVNLAAIFRAQGDRQRARQADDVVRDGLHMAIGLSHPFTIAASVGLANDIAYSGDHARAAVLSSEARDLAAGLFGSTHPLTLAAGANLSVDLHNIGQAQRAEELLNGVLSNLRHTLGPEHPTVTAVASGLRIEVCIEPSST